MVTWSTSAAMQSICLRKNINADVIVAATFNVKTNDDGNGYKVTVIGYPATFINWKTAEASDYEWIRMEKTLTTADKDKIAAVIK